MNERGGIPGMYWDGKNMGGKRVQGAGFVLELIICRHLEINIFLAFLVYKE